MRRLSNLSILAVFLFPAFLLFASNSFAERVTKIRKDGTLELDNKRVISLAGITMPPETLPLLSSLLAGRKIDVDYEKNDKQSEPPAAIPAYIFVNSEELDFPFAQAAPARSLKVMVNELLLMTGSASTEKNSISRFKDRFLELEGEARRKGEGIWSYESLR